MSELDALLDATLDDLEDLPEFKPFPAGSHMTSLTLETKEINKHPAIEATFTMVETIELADPETPENELSKAGDTASVAFMLDNEYGQGNFKKLATPIGEALGISSLREIVEQTTDLSVAITTNIRVDKTDETKKYMGVVELAVA